MDLFFHSNTTDQISLMKLTIKQLIAIEEQSPRAITQKDHSLTMEAGQNSRKYHTTSRLHLLGSFTGVEGIDGHQSTTQKVNVYVVHDDDTMGLLQWNGSELRTDGFSSLAPSAQFYSTRSDDYKLPITSFSQQSADGKKSVLGVQKTDNEQLGFTLIPACRKDSFDDSVVTSFSETPHGDAEQITLHIGGKEVMWAVPKNNEVVKVVNAEDSSISEFYNVRFRIQPLT